jgi:hypothetical protein
MKRFLILIGPALMLGACTESDQNSDTVPVNVDAKGDNGGKVEISANSAGGSLRIDGDGVNIDANLPGLDGLDINSDFDIDGVKLYPGAKITGININADSGKAEGKRSVVRFSLTAPAAPAAVLDWYAKAFAAKGITAAVTGNILNGQTKDGDNFTLTMSPDGTGSKGEFRVVA